MAEDIVRVLRVIEYTGARSVVETTIANSLQGTKVVKDLTIRVATLGAFPEILERGGKSDG